MADQYVYVKDKFFSWIPALLVQQTATDAIVSVAEYQNESEITGGYDHNRQSRSLNVKLADYPNGALPLQNVVEGSVKQYADMIELSFLHEASILYNIKERHGMMKPYTRTGDIIIAVNPFQWLPLYSEEIRRSYAKNLILETRDHDPRRHLEPHVYEASALSYRGLSFAKQNQSILVSGESGAGKTETVKIAMGFLASAVKQDHCEEKISTQDDGVILRVLDSNPLLEAFGNAQTCRNDNSSRFGKYTQLQFDRANASSTTLTLCGSICEVYLLEKSRVVSHDPSERTFHIFHQLCAADDNIRCQFWDELRGKGYESFAYVGKTLKTRIEGMDDSDGFLLTLAKLEMVGVCNDLLRTFMRSISCVLQVGNLRFSPLQDNDHSVISSPDELDLLASLLGISGQVLNETLTTRVVCVRGETTKVPLRPDVAKDAADALAKQIYQRIFLWLVKTINTATSAKGSSVHSAGNYGLIGLLDIFGFESFELNGFEQLCINYANEQLQAKFTNDVFISVFEEYQSEGISLDEIKYDDNTDVLDLIQNKTGLLAILNEECVRPKGSDYGFVNKAIHTNKGSPVLIVPRIVHDKLDFGIKHFAGDVIYNAAGFVAKNQDTLPTDLMHCVATSSNHIIADSMKDGIGNPTNAGVRNTKSLKRAKSNLVAPTVWTKYKDQLRSLMAELSLTQSRYIRCIKPNDDRKPLSMQHHLTLSQLRSSGVIGAVTLARSAFPNRLEHSLILTRFFSLLPSSERGLLVDNSPESRRQSTQRLLTRALAAHKKDNLDGFVMGKTRTYFRAGVLEYLEAERLSALTRPAIQIQSLARRILAVIQAKRLQQESLSKRLAALVEPACTIQRSWRCHAAREVIDQKRKEHEARSKIRRRKEAIIVIQGFARVILAKFERERRYVKHIRHQAKILKKQKRLRKLQFAATTIQRYERGSSTRRRYRGVFVQLGQRKHLEEKLTKLRKKTVKVQRQIDKERSDQITSNVENLQHDRQTNERGGLETFGIDGPPESLEAINVLQERYRKLQVQTKALEGITKPLMKNFNALMDENKVLRKNYVDIQSKIGTMKTNNKELVDRRTLADSKSKELRKELEVISSRFKPVANKRVEFEKALKDILSVLEKRCNDTELLDAVQRMVHDAAKNASVLQASTESDINSVPNPPLQHDAKVGGSAFYSPPGKITSPGSPGTTSRRRTVHGALVGMKSKKPPPRQTTTKKKKKEKV